jgi:hypothetical protein
MKFHEKPFPFAEAFITKPSICFVGPKVTKSDQKLPVLTKF